MIKSIIFDFDGVISDSFPVTKMIFENLKKEKGLFKDMKIENMLDDGIEETIRKSPHPKLYVLWLMLKAQKDYSEELSDTDLIPGMEKVIKYLSKNYDLNILSSNRKENIEKFLEKKKLKNYFSDIYSIKSLFGKHRSMRNILRKKRLKARHIIYVGDEDRDVLSLKKINVKVISVTWGYNSKKRLEEVNRLFIAEKPEEIIKNVKKIDKRRIEKK
ncbi:MAG: HAD-IA family hydrolase [Candidatus Woesearchaeota archaeon]